MKCPFCNGEMRPGYIQGARGVIFSERIKAVLIAKNPFNDKDKRIADSFSCSSPAFYCDTCDCLVWKKDNAVTD